MQVINCDTLWTTVPPNTYLEGTILGKIPLLFFWKIVWIWSKPFWSLAGWWVSFQDESQSVSINKSSGTELKELRDKLTQRFTPRKAERFGGLLNLKTLQKIKWEITCNHLILLMLEKVHIFVHSLVSEDSYIERTLIHYEFLFQTGIAYKITKGLAASASLGRVLVLQARNRSWRKWWAKSYFSSKGDWIQVQDSA